MSFHGMEPSRQRHDVIVIGGGPAGLSAALQLGRARRCTLVLDAGQPRNAFSPKAHGLTTRDGTRPRELLDLARRELQPYSSVTLSSDVALGAGREGNDFLVRLSSGSVVRARRLLLALGVRDELPNVQGLQAQWGRRVLHCGYCHGWEVRDKPLAVLARGEDAMAAVATLRTWSTDLLLCTDGPADFGVEQRGLLRAHGVRIVEAPLQRVESTFPNLRLLFDGAGVEERYAIFVRPKLKIWGRIPEMLGCDLIEAGRLRVGSDWQTSVPGVYAAGDIASAARHIVTAVASGAEAGMRLNSDLAREDFGGVWDQPLSAQAVESRASSARSAVPVGVA